MDWFLPSFLAPLIGVLFAPRERGLLEEAHFHITHSFGHLSAAPVPDWVRGMTLYEVFPRVYPPDGTLEAVRRDLARIRGLGVGCIWLMPIHPVGEIGRKGTYGSPYAVRDYFAIDPGLGCESDLRRLVEEVHGNGMRIIMDVVLNHAANDHVEMARHPEWFRRDRSGRFTRRVNSWSDVTDWDHANSETLDYLKSVLCYWVREFDVDGFRCDVAGLLPLDFWEQARNELQAIKPDIFLLAEGDDPRMLLKAFDATYDWDLYYMMLDVRQRRVDASELARLLERQELLYPAGSVLLRFLENHDLLRATARFGVRAFRPFAVMMFTASGIPLIYCGQELGLQEWAELFEKEVIDWRPGRRSALRFYRDLVELRRRFPVFFEGRTSHVETSAPREVAAFLRTTDSQVAVVAANFRGRAADVRLSLPPRVFQYHDWQVFASGKNGGRQPKESMTLRIPGWGYWVAVSRSPAVSGSPSTT